MNTSKKVIILVFSIGIIFIILLFVIQGINANEPNIENDNKDNHIKEEVIEVSSINVTPTVVTLKVGETSQLTSIVTPSNATNKTVTWSSSNNKVVTIDNKGLVTAIGAGTATITATTNNGKHSTSVVTVSKVSNKDKIYFPQTPNYINGDSTIIESNGKYAIIDTFTKNSCSSILKFIDEHNIETFEFMIITHFHADHMECITELDKKANIKKVYYKKVDTSLASTSELKYYNQFLNINSDNKNGYTELKQLEKNIEFAFNDFVIHIYNVSPRITSTILNKIGRIYNDDSDSDGKIDQNYESLVVTISKTFPKVTYKFAITGDIKENPYSGGVQYYQNLANAIGKVTVLKLSHHGIYSNNPESVLDVLKPKYVVVTNKDKTHTSVNKTLNYLKTFNPKPIILWPIDGLITFDVTSTMTINQ